MIFVNEKCTARDLEIFGFEKAEAIPVEARWTMAHVMHKAGVFPSVGQARKAGWGKDIVWGWSDFVVGKKKTLVCVWCPSE